MNETIWQLKKQMCAIGKRIWQKGFCAGNEGNHSVRVAKPGAADSFLCTPTGISKGFLSPNDIVVIDGQGNPIEPNPNGRCPSSEIKVHLAIYRARPDINAVVHSHPPHATAFAVAGIPLPEGIHPEAEVFLGKVRTAKYATPSTDDLPNSLLPLIDEQTNSLLMGNHGTVNFSTSLMDAYYKLEILDAYCRILILCKQIGHANTLEPQQIKQLLEVKEKFGMQDPRLACADEGCVGQDNEAFFATFPDQPATAVCACDGGHIRGRRDLAQAPPVPPAPPAKRSDGDQYFEMMVQTITDQIVAGAG